MHAGSGNDTFKLGKLHHPVTSIIYVTTAFLCILLGLATHFKYNRLVHDIGKLYLRNAKKCTLVYFHQMPITVNCHPSPVTQHLSLITVIITSHCHLDCHHPPSLSPPPTTFTIAYHHHHLLSLSPVTVAVTIYHYFHHYCPIPSPVTIIIVTVTVHHPLSWSPVTVIGHWS